MQKRKYIIPALTVACCIIMALAETLAEPPYLIKSAVKIALFAGVPLVVLKISGIKIKRSAFSLDRKSILKLIALGAVIYGIIFGVYMLTRGVVDYPKLVQSMLEDQQVNSDYFVLVAVYISLGNSFLEEFLFRLISFITLSEYTSKRTAYIFSSLMFAVYHIAFIGAAFPLPLFIASLAGLAAGGLIFDYIDDKSGKIYPSWIVHMFADWAIVTVWFLEAGA